MVPALGKPTFYYKKRRSWADDSEEPVRKQFRYRKEG